MQFLPILKGAATWVPWLYDARRGTTGGTSSARYCYAVWLRHLIGMRSRGLPGGFQSVAELGPGDSLGIGLAALLSGARRLQAFDVVQYASPAANQEVLDGLLDLFRARADVPGEVEFPQLFPGIDTSGFPHHLWSDGELDGLLSPTRAAAISSALAGRNGEIEISYVVPWHSAPSVLRGHVDIVFSQAVLEHVNDLAATYAALGSWVAPGAYMSHVVDFRSHHITPGWDGHLQYPDRVWRVVRGRRPYLLNRCAPDQHLRELVAANFDVLEVVRKLQEPTVPAGKLAREFQCWSDLDRRTSSFHVVARRAPSRTAAQPMTPG